jgi:hypothetical protein
MGVGEISGAGAEGAAVGHAFVHFSCSMTDDGLLDEVPFLTPSPEHKHFIRKFY